jgi:hypothetical protein
VLSRFVADVSKAHAETVLWRDTANGNVNRLSGKQFFRATGNTFQVEAALS